MNALDPVAALAALAVAAIVFTIAGLMAARGGIGGPEAFVTARNSMSTSTTASTVLATSLGAWIVFGPAEMATWGGLVAVIGYALAAAAPRIAIVPLGIRMRMLMPRQVAMTSFIRLRFGAGMHGFILIVMLFFLVVTVAAEVTGMALIVALLADVPLWMTALPVLAATVLYTSAGGLRASILTDRLQVLVILPFLAILVAVAVWQLGGFAPGLRATAEIRPELLSLGHLPGLETAVSLILGLMATSLFNQGYWQRVFAAKDTSALVRGFLTAAVIVMPIIILLGLFGLVAVGLDRADQPSVALFAVVLDNAPTWLAFTLVVLGLALVMSSADTALNAIAGILTADLPHAFPGLSGRRLLRLARVSSLVVAVPAFFVASQGYSVLYLFLLANLLCVAAAGPVVWGLYSRHLTGRVAMVATAAGLVGGLALFPDPAMSRGHLLGSYLVALFLPLAIASAGQMATSRKSAGFDFAGLRSAT